MATGMELHLSSMIVVSGPHRTNEGDVVSTGSDMRKPITDFDAGLPMFFVSCLQWVDRFTIFAISIVHYNHPKILEVFRVEDIGVRRIADGLSGKFIQRGFGVKALHMAYATAHE